MKIRMWGGCPGRHFRGSKHRASTKNLFPTICLWNTWLSSYASTKMCHKRFHAGAHIQLSHIKLTVKRLIGEGNGTPLQHSCLENPMDGGAWWAAVHGVTKSWTRLSDFTFILTFMHWRRKWQPTPVFLPGESQGRGSLVGCRPWGRAESDSTEAT